MNPNNPVAAKLNSLPALGDNELLGMMKRIAVAERTLTIYALAHLGEIQRRKLYEAAGFHTMFAYCVGELHYSEANAYRRLQAVQAARKFPEILTLITDGSLTVCALSIIAKHLTQENSGRLLKQIEGKSVRAVERLAATIAPLPDTRDSVRLLPSPATGGNASSVDAWIPATVGSPSSIPPTPHPNFAASPQKIMPRSPERVQFSFTGSTELRRVIDRLRELLWHKYPAGRLEDILLEAGRTYLSFKDPELLPPSKPKPPRATETRVVPRWVRSMVYRRDEGRCVFTSAEGRRCAARQSLEYDHIRPWSRGGRSDDPKNIRLLCRAHNQQAARIAGLASG
jgi:hypothetical protein